MDLPLNGALPASLAVRAGFPSQTPGGAWFASLQSMQNAHMGGAALDSSAPKPSIYSNPSITDRERIGPSPRIADQRSLWGFRKTLIQWSQCCRFTGDIYLCSNPVVRTFRASRVSWLPSEPILLSCRKQTIRAKPSLSSAFSLSSVPSPYGCGAGRGISVGILGGVSRMCRFCEPPLILWQMMG